MAASMAIARRYLVRGRVQGVGYRYFAVRAAERLGVTGFVRNLASGDVEVHAEADNTKLGLFKQELERGPRIGYVTEVIESDVPVSGSYSSFLIRG
jgi:acylphosphatase